MTTIIIISLFLLYYYFDIIKPVSNEQKGKSQKVKSKSNTAKCVHDSVKVEEAQLN